MNVREHICHICNQAFKRKSYLKFHVNNHAIKSNIENFQIDIPTISPKSINNIIESYSFKIINSKLNGPTGICNNDCK